MLGFELRLLLSLEHTPAWEGRPRNSQAPRFWNLLVVTKKNLKIVSSQMGLGLYAEFLLLYVNGIGREVLWLPCKGLSSCNEERAAIDSQIKLSMRFPSHLKPGQFKILESLSDIRKILIKK